VFTQASQSRASGDTSAMPRTFSESGVGDTEGQIRYRWFEETEVRPELLSYFGVVFPLQHNKTLIGTRDWEFTAGVNVTKGFSFGPHLILDFEDRLNLVLVAFHRPDQAPLVAEPLHVLDPIFAELELNSGFGLTSKAPEFAPEVGVLFSF